MNTQPFLAAAVQMEVEYEPYPADGTIQWILDAADEAAAKGAKLIVFPETSNAEWFFENPQAAAEVAATKDGWFVGKLCDKARQHQVYIAAGLSELDADTQRLYNATVIVGPDGKIASLYRKHFLIGYDKRSAIPGNNGFPVVDTPLGNFAAFICADSRIPEVTRCPALDGAQVLVNTSNWGGADQYTAHVPTRAVENRVWIVAANKSGRNQPGKVNVGHSMIVSPRGEIVAEGSNRAVPRSSTAKSIPVLPSTRRGATSISSRRAAPATTRCCRRRWRRRLLAGVLAERIRPDDITATASAVQVSFTKSPERTLSLALEYCDYAATETTPTSSFCPSSSCFCPRRSRPIRLAARHSHRTHWRHSSTGRPAARFTSFSISWSRFSSGVSFHRLSHPSGWQTRPLSQDAFDRRRSAMGGPGLQPRRISHRLRQCRDHARTRRPAAGGRAMPDAAGRRSRLLAMLLAKPA